MHTKGEKETHIMEKNNLMHKDRNLGIFQIQTNPRSINVRWDVSVICFL